MDENLPQLSQRDGGSLSLWLGVLLPPIVWALQMTINYALVPFQCYGGSRLPIYIVAAVALVLAITAGALALNNWRKLGRNSPDERATSVARNRFLAVLGILLSGLFSLVIIAQLAATVVFHPCLL